MGENHDRGREDRDHVTGKEEERGDKRETPAEKKRSGGAGGQWRKRDSNVLSSNTGERKFYNGV